MLAGTTAHMVLRPLLRFGLLLGVLHLLPAAVSAQTRYPVISKVEFVFSLVTHYSHLSERVNFYNSYGSPSGNVNYAVPHLVYEPVVTLYNPYNTPLTMNRSRVKIWDPPVGFAFKKNGIYLREDFATGNFHGLARFQIANEWNSAARKTFTLSLSTANAGGSPGGSITLQPGECRTFSTWVESNWTWGLEVAGGYTPRSFFDWHNGNDFTNRDGRTLSQFGAEAIATPFGVLSPPHAGFQTDGLSLSSGRPAATHYSFESTRNWSGNWVAIKLTDTIGVQAKTMRTNPVAGGPDFQVDLLKGLTVNATNDRVKAFPMSLDGIIQAEEAPVISRTFLAGNILQKPNEAYVSGKTPFASLTMIAKAGALRANSFLTQPAVPPGDLYELHFTETTEFHQTLAGPSDAPSGAPGIHTVSRSGNFLYIDFTGEASPLGTKNWFVRGTSSLADGFTDNLDSVTTVVKSMSGSGIYKAIIDLTGRGDGYFVRIEG
jgi:hypothetical protein